MSQQIVVPPLDTDEFLMHYGVPGMRWGKRKSSGEVETTRSERKVERAENRQALKTARTDIYKSASKGLWGTKTRAGVTVATALLLSPAVTNMRVGYELTKAAGYSKGKSLATGILVGTSGGIIAAELSARRSVKESK